MYATIWSTNDKIFVIVIVICIKSKFTNWESY